MKFMIFSAIVFAGFISTPALAGSHSRVTGYHPPRASSYHAPRVSPARVSGYMTRSGTYVAPSYRTAPNQTKADNWSSKPNINPYTGKEGTKYPNAPSH